MCTARKGKQMGNLRGIELVRLPAKFALHMGLPVTCGNRSIGLLAPQ